MRGQTETVAALKGRNALLEARVKVLELEAQYNENNHLPENAVAAWTSHRGSTALDEGYKEDKSTTLQAGPYEPGRAGSHGCSHTDLGKAVSGQEGVPSSSTPGVHQHGRSRGLVDALMMSCEAGEPGGPKLLTVDKLFQVRKKGLRVSLCATSYTSHTSRSHEGKLMVISQHARVTICTHRYMHAPDHLAPPACDPCPDPMAIPILNAPCCTPPRGKPERAPALQTASMLLRSVEGFPTLPGVMMHRWFLTLRLLQTARRGWSRLGSPHW